MKGILVALAAALILLCTSGPVKAQVGWGPPPPPQPVKVGTCPDSVAGVIWEVWEILVFYPNGSSTKFTRLQGPPPSPGGPSYVVMAGPDPTRGHMHWIASLSPGVKFWIAWNGDLVSINGANQVTTHGTCSLHPQYVAQFNPPDLNTPTSYLTATLDGAGAWSKGALNIPAELFAEGVYIGKPIMMSMKMAKECSDQADGDEAALYTCALSKTIGKDEKAALECARTSNTQSEFALCLMQSRLKGEQGKAMADLKSCYDQHGSSWDAYPMCMTGKHIDPNVMKVVGCAKQELASGRQPNYWSLGYCAFGDALLDPNPESAIVIQCAMESGGNPKLFAICAGGQLLAQELDKCLKYGVGGEDGCFGKNNSIKLAYDKIEHELKVALGQDSAAFQAWKAARAGIDPTKMAEAMKKATDEIAKIGSNAASEVSKAGEKAKNFISDATPSVSVGSGGIKVKKPKWL